MRRGYSRNVVVLMFVAVATSSGMQVNAADDSGRNNTDWQTTAAREEIRPEFSLDGKGGPGGTKALVIASDDQPGLHGYWRKTVDVAGGRAYRFRALRKTENVATPRRSAYARIQWRDDEGNEVLVGQKRLDLGVASYGGEIPHYAQLAQPDYPRDLQTRPDGWTVISGTFSAPKKATRAVIELHLRWAPGGSVRWADVSLSRAKPEHRTAKLAAVYLAAHKAPPAKTPVEACAVFAPYIKEAAEKGADLICLHEYLTSTFTDPNSAWYKDLPEAAEPIPGPSTKYLSNLARKYDIYIVAGLVERVDPLIYNTAVLIGPKEGLVGKYRKVCLTQREGNSAGIAPGHKFPVFDTRFGKVGMMLCLDVQYPEVARRLKAAGAEVIAVPIAGNHPVLARARAIENQIYLVLGGAHSNRIDWLETGIIGPAGHYLASTNDSGTVVVTTVDLGGPQYWPHQGDIRGRIARERPPGWEPASQRDAPGTDLARKVSKEAE